MNIETMSDEELLKLYNNCQAAIENNKPNKARAEEILEQLMAVWQKRDKADSPETGLLKTMGYRVGNGGLPTRKRWDVLDRIMSTPQLPFVGSPAYMKEWGGPNSATRYRKLHRVIVIQRSSASHKDGREKACADWSEDLDYLEREWQPAIR